MQEFDIIIVGAGLVGASLVSALQRLNLNIALLEKHLPDFTHTASHDFRPISLAYGSVQIFRTLGIWSLLAEAASPIRAVEVSEEGSLGAVHFTAQQLKVDALGYVVPFAQLHYSLYQRAAQQNGVEIISVKEIVAIERRDEQMHVTVETVTGQRQLSSALVIGCDGAQSRVRKLLTLPVVEKYQHQVALTALLTLENTYADVALERFTPAGTLAILPLQLPRHCGLVMTMTEEAAKVRENWLETDWIDFITQHLFGRLPKIQRLKKGGQFPLQTIVAKQQISPGVVLLGNAAHTIYPLAAQGFNLALRDAAALAEILVAAKQNLQSFGAESVLQCYVDWRQQDQVRIAQVTQFIARFFALRFPGAGKIRGLGLLTLDLLTPVKKRFAQLTMGLAGKVPKLMRGLPL